MTSKITRRDFLKKAAVSGAAMYASPILSGLAAPNELPDLTMVEGDDPKAIVRKSIDLLGGMGKFVKRGDIVVVKPNIGWNRKPEQAATTNPDIVAEVVRMCLDAGAKQVKVFDIPCESYRMTYRRSGIEKAAKDAGAQVLYPDDRKMKSISIPGGEKLKSWEVFTEALETDVLIDLPIAKHHSSSRLTLAIKNLMGIMGGERGALHPDLHQNLADFLTRVKPHLSIIDAYRILVDHGPTGGRLEDVRLTKKVIAGTDIVAADALAATLFGIKAEEIGYLRNANRMGLGEIDLSKRIVKTVKI